MKPLTQRQQKVLTFIKDYHKQWEFFPSVREIAEDMEISVKGVHDHLVLIEKKGKIKRIKGIRRGFIL